MRSRRLTKRLLRAFRGGIAAASALAFLAASVGVPLPSGVRKDRSVAFPCMYRSCGCHDAAGCKDHCCCFSNEEKLAWAAEHHVDATPFADTSSLALESRRAGIPRPSCANCEDPSRSTSDVAQATCQLAADTNHDPCCTTDSPPTPEPAKTAWLSIAAYRHCTGLAPLWTLLGAALPPPKIAHFEHEWVAVGHVCDGDSFLTFTLFSPPTPPPRA